MTLDTHSGVLEIPGHPAARLRHSVVDLRNNNSELLITERRGRRMRLLSLSKACDDVAWTKFSRSVVLASLSPRGMTLTLCLGKGSQGGVYLGTLNESNAQCAVKILPKSRARSRSEIRIAAKIPVHENVVRIKKVLEMDAYYALCMEHVDSHTLRKKVVPGRGLPEELVRDYATQLVRALCTLHAHGIVHRDVKLENVLIQSRLRGETLKLCDFGLAAEGTRFREAVGTAYTMAPEIDGRSAYRKNVDVWAAGVVILALATGKRPFDSTRRKARLSEMKIRSENGEDCLGAILAKEELAALSDGLKSLLRGMLQVSPSKRISAAGAMAHPWLNPADCMQCTSVGRFRTFPRSALSLADVVGHVVAIMRFVSCLQSTTLRESALLIRRGMRSPALPR